MKIDGLERLTGQPRRNIRFLIAEQVVPEPYSRGRGASYGPEHIRALEIYSALKAQGIASLDVIREQVRRDGEGNRTLVLAPVPGVELRISSEVLDAAGTDELLEKIAEAVRRAASETNKAGGIK